MTKGQIVFSENIANDFVDYCRKNKKGHIVFICDVNTERHCLKYFDHKPNVIVIESGEASKSIMTYSSIISQLIACKTNKSSLIVNLGGGVVTDIGGFAASTYMRGIDFVNIPTTLMGMVDAGIGGKTGIDFQFNKNYLGTFSIPEIIWLYPEFLQTLAPAEIASGSAEMIKTGIIANQLLFKKLLANESLGSLIQMTADTKQGIIKTDMFDKGERQLLNFGHTIGHAYESYRLAMESPVHHGFAVAKGMMAESRIAYHLNLINQHDLNQILDCIAIHTGQSELTKNELAAIEAFLLMDKKNINSEIIFSLPSGIGSGKTKVAVTFDVIQSCLFNA